MAEHRTLPDGMTEADLADDFKRSMLMGIWSADLSVDGSTLAFTRDTVVQLIDVETWKQRLKFAPEPNGITTLAFSAGWRSGPRATETPH